MKLRNTVAAVSFVAASVLSTRAAAFGPADYVYVPAVAYGEREIDFKAGTRKFSNEPRESAASLGFGYGLTQFWFTELYVKYKRENGNGSAFDAFEFENKFQLTQPGQYPVDVGFIVEIERPQLRSEGYEVKVGPLFQTEFGKTQLNANLLLQRNYRAEQSAGLQLGYQWQVKYRWRQAFEIGAQGFGDVGRLSHIAPRDAQTHLLGPAVFGKCLLGGRHAITYNAAFLFDAGEAKHSKTLRTQVEYEF